MPPTVCVVGALIELSEFTITLRVNGGTADVLPTVSGRPRGDEVNVRSTVFGSSWTLAVRATPWVSVAISVSSRFDG